MVIAMAKGSRMGWEMGLASQRLALFVCKAAGQRQKHCRPVSPSKMPFSKVELRSDVRMGDFGYRKTTPVPANTTRNVFQFL